MSKRRRQDDDLRRYYAYRCLVWEKENPGKEWKDLADLLHVKRPEITALKGAKNGSHEKLENFAAALGPQSRDDFQQLAREWAEKYPTWGPDQPLPERITHTGDPLLDGTSGGPSLYSDSFRAAARALTGMTGCSVEQARRAAEATWGAHPGHEDDVFGWVALMRPHIRRLLQESPAQPSGLDETPSETNGNP